MEPISPIVLSAAVENAIKSFDPQEKISAVQLIQKIFESNPYYASGKAKAIKLSDTPDKKTVSEWLDQVKSLFDWEKIQEEPDTTSDVNSNPRTKAEPKTKTIKKPPKQPGAVKK